MLYFIKSGNYCKIGYTRDKESLFKRLRNYLSYNPSYQILDIRKGDKNAESHIHSLIPSDLYHYGEWCVWNKEIARLWLRFHNISPNESIDDYFIKRNNNIKRVIVMEYKNTPCLNFIRYFKKESNLDMSEPDREEQWRVP